MAGRPYVLGESTWETVRNTHYEVAVLPWGATEAHNRHLPYATDSLQVEHVAHESARIAWEAGTKVTVLPVVPFGVNTGQMEIPLCLNMNPSTQTRVLEEIAKSLEGHGVKKLLILNGHGGNCFRQIIRELQPRVKPLLCQIHWFRSVEPRPFFDDPGDHAGELETSVMMEVAPNLVAPLSQATDGYAKPFKVRGFREGWAWTQRHWIKVTADTGTGNPFPSTREKGQRYLSAVCEQIAGFLTDLAATDVNEMYGSS